MSFTVATILRQSCLEHREGSDNRTKKRLSFCGQKKTVELIQLKSYFAPQWDSHRSGKLFVESLQMVCSVLRFGVFPFLLFCVSRSAQAIVGCVLRVKFRKAPRLAQVPTIRALENDKRICGMRVTPQPLERVWLGAARPTNTFSQKPNTRLLSRRRREVPTSGAKRYSGCTIRNTHTFGFGDSLHVAYDT